jgi:hypothetical protein
MSQNQAVNLSIAGLYTAPNDFSGVPAGAMDEALNVSIDQKNLLQSRRGFADYRDPVSVTPGVVANRLTSFSSSEILDTRTEYVIARCSDAILERSGGPGESTTLWYPWPGTFEDPASDAKLRFLETNRRLYCLTSQGPMLLDIQNAGSGGNIATRAGVPKAVDLVAEAQDAPGFLQPNSVATPRPPSPTAAPCSPRLRT